MADSSRRHSPPPIRSAGRNRGAPRRRSGSPADLPPPPHSRYHGVRQREWGTWVAEITDRETSRRIWLGTFQSAAQAAWRHEIENVRLHCSDCGDLNFPLGTPVPELVVPPHRGRAVQLEREDREAWERLEAERAGVEYMANPRRQNPERVAAEAAAYAMYERRRGGGGGGDGDDGLGGGGGGDGDDGLNFSDFDFDD